MQLQLSHIQKSYGTKSVLKDASFSFEKGKIYGLLGRNGAGKTTLFNCLSGETGADQGEALLVDGQSRDLRAEDVGYVFATPVLPEFLTGYEFIKFYLDINRSKIQEAKSIESYFEMMKIQKEDQHRLVKDYSHGMKNKLQMLCFFITKPPVILLDEPLTSFDVVVALEMKNLLREMKQDHIIIFSTHILQLAADLCDDIVILHQGTLDGVDTDMLGTAEFEDRIFDILKDD